MIYYTYITCKYNKNIDLIKLSLIKTQVEFSFSVIIKYKLQNRVLLGEKKTDIDNANSVTKLLLILYF